jgi:hypothetical protein
MTRTSSEVVVEKMGSVAKRHTQGRRMLNTLEKELFLHWNGPTPITENDTSNNYED